MNNKTAILIFANSATHESKQIPESVMLFRALNKDILNKVKKTNKPYFISNEKNQKGKNFGEKLSNAIQHVLNKGFDYVIAVGNDTPELKTTDLNLAIKNTLDNKLTFGPSKDGGFYLMSFHKTSFHKKEYSKLSWQSNSLFSEIISLVKQPVFLLNYLQDIDTFTDLNNLNLKGLNYDVKSIICRILQIQEQHKTYLYFFYNTLCKNTLYNKGSPFSIAHF